MFYLITTLIFATLSLFTIAVCFYALKRINQYECLIIEFQNIINFATTKMKQVDAKGHYESDDETGFFFEQLKELQTLLNNIFEQEEETSGKENKEKE